MKRSTGAGTIAALALTCVFGATMLLSLAAGSSVYRQVEERVEANSEQRVGLSYITARIHAGDETGMVRVEPFGGVEAVYLSENLGGQTYDKFARLDGKPVSGFGVLPSATANTMETMRLIREKMEELKQYFPKGVDYVIANDTSKFVSASIHEVVKTLFEGVLLVFIIMFLFLQNFRYTIIPTIVVPIALMGTLAVMKAFGFSINMLTMFAMVLAIGLLVDDAIVVVENVERIMEEEGCSPREAASKSMDQIPE